MDIIETIKTRYRQHNLKFLNSLDELEASDMRRTAFDVGAAVLASVILQLIVQRLMLYIIAPIAYSVVDIEWQYELCLTVYSMIVSYLPKIIPFAILYRKYKPVVKLYPKYQNRFYLPVILFFAIFTFGMIGSEITSFINYILQLLFGAGEIPDIMEMTRPSGFATGIINLLSASIAAPLAEEYIYRHQILRSLRPMGDTPAVIISALIFGLAHGNFDQFAYCFLSGIIFSLVAVRYGNIAMPVVLHFANNFLVTIIRYESLLLNGNEIWDGFIKATADIGTVIVNSAYFASPLIIILLILSGAPRLVPVTADTKKQLHEKLRTAFCPMMIFAVFVMLMLFT